eukprot:608878-Amphidinium_carterae.2
MLCSRAAVQHLRSLHGCAKHTCSARDDGTMVAGDCGQHSNAHKNPQNSDKERLAFLRLCHDECSIAGLQVKGCEQLIFVQRGGGQWQGARDDRGTSSLSTGAFLGANGTHLR